MSTMSIKKISAAALAAVLGFSAVSKAAQITLPYKTFFTSGHDSNNDSYGPGQLEGQNNWVDENGEPTNVATVNAGNTGVTLNAAPAAGAYSDVYDSNIAGHTGGAGITTPLNPATYGGFVTVNYSLNITAPTGGQSTDSVTNPESKAGFGVQVLGANDSLIASIFTVAQPNHVGEEDVQVQSGGLAAITDPTLAPPQNGSAQSYSLSLNFTNHTFTVFVGGLQGGTYAFDPAEIGQQIGGITLATDNGGTNTAVFSAFSVVPEPASLAMVGLGGLMLLAKRPKRTV